MKIKLTRRDVWRYIHTIRYVNRCTHNGLGNTLFRVHEELCVEASKALRTQGRLDREAPEDA